MAKTAIIESQGNLWAETLYRALCARNRNEYYFASPLEFCAQASQDGLKSRCLYVPAFSSDEGSTPDLSQAEAIFQQLAQLKSGALVLISSAMVYGVGPGRQAFVQEDYCPPGNGGKRICDQWNSLER